MDLAEKKIALLVDNYYQEMEVWYPLFRLQEAGAKVIPVGAKAGETYTSKLGYPVKSQLSYDDVRESDFDGVVVPGGYAPDHIRRHAGRNEFHHFTRRSGEFGGGGGVRWRRGQRRSGWLGGGCGSGGIRSFNAPAGDRQECNRQAHTKRPVKSFP